MPDQDPIRGRMQQEMPTTRELALVLFRRRRVFVRVAGLVLAVSILYALFGTKYQANMKVLVRRGRADAPVSATENAPVDLTRMAITEEELNSEVELLRDEEVLRKVVQEVGTGRDWLHFLRIGEGDAQRVERAARRLGNKINVEPIKKTNLIAITYAADDPAKAAKILHALANAYLEKHTAVHRPGGELPFFEQQIADARRSLDSSKQMLLGFTVSHRVVDAARQRDLAIQRWSELGANAGLTNVELAETNRRVAELQTLLATLPERSTTQLRTADNPELLKELKATLVELELKRIQLLTKFEPNHRLVQEADSQISQVLATISAEASKPLTDETTDKDAHYEWAKAELQKAQVEREALQARQSATEVQEAIYRNMAQQYERDAVTQEELTSTEKTALENYLLYVRKQQEARMSDALDRRGIVNVAIAQEPVAPALPVSSAWMVIAVGFIAAGTAGVGAAFAAEYVDPAFRTPDEVEDYLGAPVLATLATVRRGRLSA